jgi:hypothetical protein
MYLNAEDKGYRSVSSEYYFAVYHKSTNHRQFERLEYILPKATRQVKCLICF